MNTYLYFLKHISILCNLLFVCSFKCHICYCKICSVVSFILFYDLVLFCYCFFFLLLYFIFLFISRNFMVKTCSLSRTRNIASTSYFLLKRRNNTHIHTHTYLVISLFCSFASCQFIKDNCYYYLLKSQMCYIMNCKRRTWLENTNTLCTHYI